MSCETSPTPEKVAEKQYFQSKEELASFIQTVNEIGRRATGKPLVDVRVGDPNTVLARGRSLAPIPEGYVAIVRPNGIQYVPEEEDPFSDKNYTATVSKLPYRFYDEAAANALDPMLLFASLEAQKAQPTPPSAAAATATPHDQTPAWPTDDSGSST